MIEFGDLLSPREFLDQIAVQAALGNRALSAAIAQSPTATYLQTQPFLQPFSARPISADATLFESDAPKATRRLLIAFTGRKNRMMLSLPLFLQELDASIWDVLVLRDGSLSQFRNGCTGLAATFPELARSIGKVAERYQSATAIGASMGGLAAIRLALSRPEIRGVSIGGRFPTDAGRLLSGEDPGPAFDAICACQPRAMRNLIFVYPEGHARDRDAAHLCIGLIGGIDLPIKDHNRHFVLWQFHQTGSLGPFLEKIADPAIPPDDMISIMAGIGLARVPVVTATKKRSRCRRIAGRLLRKLWLTWNRKPT